MTIDLRLPAPSRKELFAIGGAAALAVSGIVEGPAALLLAAVPLVRAHLTPTPNDRQRTVRATVGVENGGRRTTRARRGTATRRSAGNGRRTRAARSRA
jgi:hypothetical protein